MARARTTARRPAKKAAKPAGKRPCDPKLLGKKLDIDATRFHSTFMLDGILDNSARVAELEMDCKGEVCVIKWTRVAHVPIGGRRAKNVVQDMSGCGFGTQMYEAAYQIACSEGKRLTSDTARSAAAESFWTKQAKKGRAVCVGKGGDKFDYDKWNNPSDGGRSIAEYANELDLRVEAGEIDPADASAMLDRYKTKNETLEYGAWPCRQYTMKTSCPTETGREAFSLKGLRSRRGRKSCSTGHCGVGAIKVRTASSRPRPKLTAANSTLISGTDRGRKWRR